MWYNVPMKKQPADPPITFSDAPKNAIAPVRRPAGADPMIERLDAIVELLQRSDRRARRAAWGATLRMTLHYGLIIGSAALLYLYGDEVMSKITSQAAQSAAKYAQEQSSTFMEQLQKLGIKR
ncbi:MAG: hypothetical protein G01um101425_632 [Candidatus Peregrinibacteria bacterium Gr01-1014_25]|nr:MAG: hypothetical protein G01um101425_632 [Candidatus Peregrinibacteria bacterium Gr01-1014_25]